MIQTKTLPFVPLRGLLVLPYVMVHLDIGRESSINAIQYAMNEDKYICLAAQKNADEEFPQSTRYSHQENPPNPSSYR